MKYALLIYQDDAKWDDADEAEREKVYAEHGRFGELLESRNASVGGAELAASSSATTVRKSDGGAVVTAGPYAETAEQLGGFYLVEAADLDEALEFARAMPGDIIEVRALVTSPT